MRLAILILALAIASAHCGLFNFGKIKDFFSGGNLGGKFKNLTITTLKKALNRTGILGLTKKLASVKTKLLNKLKLTKRQQEDLDRRMQNMTVIEPDHNESWAAPVFDVNRKSVGKMLFQSDMMLTRRQMQEVIDDVEGGENRTKRQAFKDEYYPRTTWESGVFYYFEPGLDFAVKNVFIKGAKHWSDNTCVNFTEDPTAEHRIKVFREEGCWSHVGRIGGEQYLSLGYGCETVGTATHELGHALGLFHTMSRYDRDQFITVQLNNVEPDFVDQYTKETELTTSNYGLTYDFGSIMHYGASSASFNRQPTMVAYDIRYQESMGSSILSFIDKLMLNDHYKCRENCPKSSSADCKNGGFPHPRNCKVCICPSGYGGDFCDKRPIGCGNTYEAKDSAKVLVDRLGFHGGERDDFMFCNYWITAPEGKVVEVKLRSISHGYAIDGCIYGGIEIKTSDDQTNTGYRFCSSKDSNTILRSNLTRVPIITFNRAGQQQVIVEYRAVIAERIDPSKPTKPGTEAPAEVQTSSAKPATTSAVTPNVSAEPSTTITPAEVRTSPAKPATTPVVTSSISTEPSTKAPVGTDCKDNTPLRCRDLERAGFCYKSQYSYRLRRELCAKTCHLCRS